jgi:hypothetical protein
MMAEIYHRQDIQQAVPRRNCFGRGARLRGLAVWASLLALLPFVAGCDPVQVVEGSATHVSIRYDGVANGLDDAKEMAQQACGRYGKTAKLRKTYWEGLGVGERFAFFDCI